jgi:hypothetical protein
MNLMIVAILVMLFFMACNWLCLVWDDASYWKRWQDGR